MSSQGNHSAATTRRSPLEKPLVIQCQRCRYILGDSTCFVCTDSSLQTLTLNGASGVDLLPQRTGTVTSPGARGQWESWTQCQFVAIGCANCGSIVGQQFLSTPTNMAFMRDMLSFNIAAICSYELGDPELSVAKGNDSITSYCLQQDAERVMQLEVELIKVKNMLLLYNERLEKLESSSSTRQPNSQPATSQHTAANQTPSSQPRQPTFTDRTIPSQQRQQTQSGVSMQPETSFRITENFASGSDVEHWLNEGAQGMERNVNEAQQWKPNENQNVAAVSEIMNKRRRSSNS